MRNLRIPLLTLLAAVPLLPSCASNRAYVYTCPSGKAPFWPSEAKTEKDNIGKSKKTSPHGRRESFWKLFDRACTSVGGATPTAELSQRFGRLLPPGRLPADFDEHTKKLRKLSREMQARTDKRTETVAAGMIFLGQFIDHDITLDVVTQLGSFSDPSQIPNLRTPRLDLDSLYLGGLEAAPFLYDKDGRFLTNGGTDFARIDNGDREVAVIGDPRNDENGLIAQLHLLFLRFHNKVMAAGHDFHDAQQLVQRHYQWIVRNEFLPAIVDDASIAWAEQVARDDWHTGPGLWARLCGGYRVPDMPIEFAAAAYRFGHSQIADDYLIQGKVVNLFTPPRLSSFEPVPADRVVKDWTKFFETGPGSKNLAAPIDTRVSKEVYKLPFATGDQAILPLRNLLRGDLTFALPSGEAAADYLGVARIPESDSRIRFVRMEAQLEETPLWYYILAEAENNGGVMTGVGGRIVALTLIRMLHNDPDSYIHAEGWKPTLGTGGSFTMADLARYTQS